MVSRVVVSSPSTIANLGPGFDVFGLALAEPVDIVEGRISKKRGIRVLNISGVGAEGISRDPKKNAVSIAASSAMELMGRDEGLEFTIKKGIKPGSGIGSSGAGAVAGAVIANELFDGGLPHTQLIEAAAEAEGKIAGSAHYDNVTPALVGGFTIITSIKPLEYVRLEPPRMKIVVAQPAMELPTKLGRQLVPKEVSLHDAVANVGKASAMVAALKSGDLKLFGRCMVDSIAEPVRIPLVPGFHDVKRAALKSGALGAALAGSGPSVFAIADVGSDAEEIAGAMRRAFKRAGVGCETVITTPGLGVRVVAKE
ncbi:MAG: homoserine kinase [Candidatus Hodarchaeaceae archaeon]|nr:homoserine kinase [Candidatus Hodarchaeaceae archaeon]